jgi:pullulanase
MGKYIMLFGFLTHFFSGKAPRADFSKYPVYTGGDLGLTYTKNLSRFRIWSPEAKEAEIIFYPEGTGGKELARQQMNKGRNGEWLADVPGDQKGKFYVFRVKINNKWMDEVPDPYARAVGINGRRAMVVDLDDTDPAGWKKDKSPRFDNATDAIIYELHIRDASISPSSGIKNKGKFLGLTETGTKNADGLSTGLDHIKELGVTHVHLLPCFDFNSIDESKPGSKYNWGYDPLNFNVPEGSYSTNPYDGVTRIREFKQLIHSFHENGLRVVMDVAYNHTALTEASNFNQLVPGYYYRQTKDGKFSNATACGNETASERPMMRKFMLESMKYWVEEYHVDGFRVDLMGVHDIATMNLISAELHAIKADILLYGEGWTAGPSPLPDSLRALKANASKLDRIAVFSDDIRDGIKGSVFNYADKGFASGKPAMEESIKFGIVASCKHPQVDYSKVNYSKAPYAAEPWQTVTYCECHDNHCLWDKLAISAKETSEQERINMHKLSLSIVLTSQGIIFLHAGTEFLRTKRGVENSFQSPDSINAIDWSLKTKNKEVFEYVKALIKLRKEHPGFHMTKAKTITERIRFDVMPPGVISYHISGWTSGEKWKSIHIIFNGTGKEQKMLSPGMWRYAIRSNNIEQDKKEEAGCISVMPYSCSILYHKD